MQSKTENLTNATAAEMEFGRMYEEMERSHIKPLWTDEARILPRTPSPGGALAVEVVADLPAGEPGRRVGDDRARRRRSDHAEPESVLSQAGELKQ